MESAPQAGHALPPFDRFWFTIINNLNLVDGANQRHYRLIAAGRERYGVPRG
jgi:hypothetical protein